jgi:hypothetical protein
MEEEEEMEVEVQRPRSPSPEPQMSGGAKPKRSEVVKRVMREHGLSLGQASKYVKEHKLY